MFKCTVCGRDAHMVVDEFYLCEAHWMEVMKTRSGREKKKYLTVRHAAQARFRDLYPDIPVTDAVSDEHALTPPTSSGPEIEVVVEGTPPSPETEVPSRPPTIEPGTGGRG